MLAIRGGRHPTLEETFNERNIDKNKRRRITKALEILRGPQIPTPNEMVRIGIKVSTKDIKAIMASLQQVGFNTSKVLHVMATPYGVELVVAKSYVPAFVDRAHVYNIELAEPMPFYPTMPDNRRTLLRKLAEATSTASHPHIADFFQQWEKEVIALQSGTSSAPPSTLATVERQQSNPAQATCPMAPSPKGETPTIPVNPPSDSVHVLLTDSDEQGKETEELLPGGPSSDLPIIACARTQASRSFDSINAIENYMPQRHAHHVPTLVQTSADSQNVQMLLDISYLNVYGLSHEKMNCLCTMLKHNSVTFLTETWHTDSQTHMSNPHVVAISPEINRSQLSRGKGGLLAIAHRDVAPLIRVVTSTEYAITLQITNIVITAVYLPPSLVGDALRDTLELIDCRTNILLGDINAPLGLVPNASNAQRIETIVSFASKRGLALKTPCLETRSSKIDHVLACPSLHIMDYMILTPPIHTDHPILSFNVRIDHAHRCESTTRYNIKWFNTDAKAKTLTNIINILCHRVSQLTATTSNLRKPSDAKDAIDLLDAALLFVIQYSLENTAGTYVPKHHPAWTTHFKAKDLDIASASKAICAAHREENSDKELFNLDPTLTPTEEAVRHFTNIYRFDKDLSDTHWDTPNHTSAPTLTSDLVIQTIKDYPNGKSPGIDGVDGRVMLLLTGSDLFVKLLTTLYNQCLQHGYTPARWNVSVVSPIPKPGKDARYIANRRPISLTVLFRRIFEKYILTPLAMATKLNYGQAGFRTGFSCPMQILLAEQARHNGMKLQTFLDLKNAYDSVPIKLLLVKLGKKNIPSYLILLVESLMTNCFSKIAVNGSLTSKVPLERGLFQGSLLSPILFNVFIDDLADIINGPHTQHTNLPHCLLYADDILLVAPNREQMQTYLAQVQTWCQANEMYLNIPKCGTFPSGSGLHVSNSPIPVVEAYTYLGVPLSPNGIMATSLLETMYNNTLGAFMTAKNSLAGKTWPTATKINVYKIHIRSIMVYGAPLLVLSRNKNTSKAITAGIKKLQSLQNECIKWIFDRSIAITAMESLAGLTLVKFRFAELTAHFRIQLESSPDVCHIKHWLNQNNACPIIKACSKYPIPQDRDINTIKAHYRAQATKWAQRKSILTRYILPECKLENGMDTCLTLQDPRIRKLAIAWRCNAIGLHQLCRICNEPFTRRHTQCNSFGITGSLATQCLEISNSGEHGPLYTIVDHLLNKRKYQLFSTAITMVIANLASRNQGNHLDS
jgi:hypothetical protein